MIKTEIINGKVFLEQTTYYVYDNEDMQKTDKPNFITSNKKEFNKIKKQHKSYEDK